MQAVSTELQLHLANRLNSGSQLPYDSAWVKYTLRVKHHQLVGIKLLSWKPQNPKVYT